MAEERSERVEVDDGSFGAFLALPQGGGGPGILLLHEIFGIAEFAKAKARDLADAGYVVLVPDVFWRLKPGFLAPDTEEGVQEGMAMANRFFAEVSPEQMAADLGAALAHLRGLAEVGGRKVAAMGYCLGGTLAYSVAVASDPDALVSYYGSGVPGMLDAADAITCSALLHFGGADPFISMDAITQVQQRLAGRPDVEVVVHEGAGHAFENSFHPMFSNPDASAESWRQTLAFLGRNLEG
jgi:carboxymethylenebutenolidase